MIGGIAIGRTPETFPFGFEAGGDSVVFLELTREAFARASFLDARVLEPGARRWSIPWPQLARASARAALAERCGYIFHIGHVGSTLLSRLIGAHPRAFALREPLVLRTFAHLRSPSPDLTPERGVVQEAWALEPAAYEERLSVCLQLLSRTFDPQDLSILKATSFVAEIAAALLGRAAAPRALLMYVSPQSYLATIFGGPNSRKEAALLLPARAARLLRRVAERAAEVPAHPQSEGEAVALAWACETAALARAAEAAGGRAVGLDFDAFLAAPEAHLSRALRHFDLAVDARMLARIVSSPDMRRYSKAPEYAYDAGLRRDVLAAAGNAHGAEIRRGLAWLERGARRCGPIRDALEFAAAATP